MKEVFYEVVQPDGHIVRVCDFLQEAEGVQERCKREFGIDTIIRKVVLD